MSSATASIIRDEDEYTGVRVSLHVALAMARLTFHVDVNVGDPMVPPAQDVDVPRWLVALSTPAGRPSMRWPTDHDRFRSKVRRAHRPNGCWIPTRTIVDFEHKLHVCCCSPCA